MIVFIIINTSTFISNFYDKNNNVSCSCFFYDSFITVAYHDMAGGIRDMLI